MLVREEIESAEEWTGCITVKANQCEYKERDRRLKEQFVNGINDNYMMTAKIRELAIIKRRKP